MDGPTPPRRPTQSDRDRIRWVSGAGRYVADIAVPDALGAAFLRSPHAHAEIAKIDVEAARAMPGVVAVITGEDCKAAGFGNFRALMRHGMDGPRPLIAPFRAVLATNRVRFVGEPVACVIATSPTAATDAAEAIAVEYRPLSAVIGLDQAPTGPAIHSEAPGNLAFLYQVGEESAVQEAFARAAQVVSTRFDLPRLAPATMEPGGIIARYDEAEATYHLTTPHQGINEIRLDLAAVLNVPVDQIRIELPDVGGGFGLRSPAYPEHAAILLAAKLTGCTIRWVPTRSEAFLNDYHGRSTRLSGQLALDAAHRFTALEIVYETDLGAYVTTVGALVNVHNPLQSGTGTYAIPAAVGRFAQYFTNAGPIGPYRGAGRPDTAMLIERLVDCAAAACGVDPLELRSLNAIPPASFPYRTAFGSTYDNADYAVLIEGARDAAGWNERETRRIDAARRNTLFGRGLALFTEIAGGGAATQDEVRVMVDHADGRATARIETVTGGSGQSQAETYAFVLAALTGIDPADIVLAASPSDTTLAGAGSIGSRSTISAGSAVADAGRQIRDRLLAVAGLRANAAPADLTITDGRISRVDGSAVMTIAEAIAGAGGEIVVTGIKPVAPTFPSGCHVAEVEIDRETGAVCLTRYVAIDDSGNLLNPKAAEAQIHGGIVQGIGEVLGEGMRYDANGQPLTGSFMDYAMPRADDVPDLLTANRPTVSHTNPLGAKGLGEVGTTGALPAVANAIADALVSIGAELPPLPCTPARIWDAIRAAGS